MADNASKLMIMSIHPRHIQRILQGEKTVELRKTRPAVEAGQPAALYATAPTSAVVATCVIDRVVVGIPGQVRSALLGPARVTAQEYDAYLSGSQQAVAIYLRDVSVLNEPISFAQFPFIRNHKILAIEDYMGKSPDYLSYSEPISL